MGWRQLSLRSRLTVLGGGGLAAGLVAGGAVLVAVLDVTLQNSADAEATRTGEDLARLVAEGALPEPVPVAGEQVVQVVDSRERVLAASIGADRLVPMLRDQELAEVREGGKLTVAGDRIGVNGPVRVVAVPVEWAGEVGGETTVLVAKPLADLQRSVDRARLIAMISIPVFVVAEALVMWRVIGAALRPVEALRAGTAEIAGAGRPATLPVPESRDEIHRLAVTLNDMLLRLEAARAKQRAFVADAAHELRSPLANMRTELEVALRLKDTEWSTVADNLLTDTQRLARLVDDLLLLARGDDAQARQRAAENVELGGLLRAVAERYPSPPVVVTNGPPVWIRGEPEALRRVVSNLVDNAVRYAHSQVTLAAVPGGRFHLLTVTDDGPGIPAGDRERAFDRFTRLDDARNRDAGGAGLGLAIVRELVHRHGGTVRLGDAGPGLRAEVRLPASGRGST